MKTVQFPKWLSSEKGFTLVELLVVVGLIIIVVGVSGDIVISLVRSYSKTQITNEIEQNGNFVMQKLQKELRNADSVDSVSSSSLSFFRRESDGSRTRVTYEIESFEGTGYISRQVASGAKIKLTNDTHPVGVSVIPVGSSFTQLSANPDVIKVVFIFRQIGDPTAQFTQDLVLETTIVVRGSY